MARMDWTLELNTEMCFTFNLVVGVIINAFVVNDDDLSLLA